MLKFLKPRIAIPVDTSHKFESKENIRDYLHTAKLFSDTTKSNDESTEMEERVNKSVNSTYISKFRGIEANTHQNRARKYQNSVSMR